MEQLVSTVGLRELYLNLACIGLVIPTSTVDCERGFTTVGRIKTEQPFILSCVGEPSLHLHRRSNFIRVQL